MRDARCGMMTASTIKSFCHPERSVTESKDLRAAGGTAAFKCRAELTRHAWLPPAGRSFGCARGLALLRMTGSSLMVDALIIPHRLSRIAHPSQNTPGWPSSISRTRSSTPASRARARSRCGGSSNGS